MIYSFFKRILPAQFTGFVEMPENIETIRMAILKIGEGQYVQEKGDHINVIPYGAWNPLGMIPLKNYQKLAFELTKKGEAATEVVCHATRKWSSASAKLYTGMVYFLILLAVLAVGGWALDYNTVGIISGVIGIVFGIIFAIAFLIDYFFLFSKSAVKRSIEMKILQRIAKYASLLQGTDLEEVRKSLKVRKREEFLKAAISKGRWLVGVSGLQNLLFIVVAIFWVLMADSDLPIRSSRREVYLVVTLGSMLVIFIVHMISVVRYIFMKASNITLIMDAENIPGGGRLSLGYGLAIFPVLSFLSTIFAVRFLFQVKSKEKE
jgi:hypothetical protein